MPDEPRITETDVIRWSETLAGIARTGLGFTESRYEQERFEEILKVAGDMRVAAGSHSRAGSVVYDLEVPDFGDGLQMSGVSLTSATSNVLGTQKATDPLGKALPGPPIALRDFARQDTVALYVEAYDQNRKPQLPLVTADLRTADGKVIGKLPEQKQASSLHADQGAIGLTAAFPLSGLQPGVYLVHIEARSDNGKDVRQREIPIRVW